LPAAGDQDEEAFHSEWFTQRREEKEGAKMLRDAAGLLIYASIAINAAGIDGCGCAACASLRAFLLLCAFA